MTAPVSDDLWFRFFAPRHDAPVRLYCLPYAGGSANTFQTWSAAFGSRIEVVGICLPGREKRWRDISPVDPTAVAAAITRQGDRPFGILGHSMGARIGFEVVRELRRQGLPLPVHLFASGACPPDCLCVGPFDGLSEVDDTELRNRIVAGGGVPEAIVATPGFLDMFLPTLRADLGWLDRYVFTKEPALPIPVTAFAGAHDDVAPADRVAGWHRHTTERFELHTMRGNHFFLHDRIAEIAEVVEPTLLGARSAR